jgi:transcriptional regulator with XRE-family HTH domain
MTIDKTKLAGRIKELREERFQKNARQCSKFLGIPYTTYLDYEKGTSKSVDVLALIAEKFGVTLDWLISGRGQKYSQHALMAEAPSPYGQFEPMDRFYIELGRAIEDLKPAADREVLRQHEFMILRPHIDVDKIWKRYKQIREDLDRKPNTRE